MRLSMTFAALAAVLTTVGCTSGPTTVRGQSPQYGPAGGPVDTGIRQVGHDRGVRSHPIYDATIGQHAYQGTAHFSGHSGMGQSEFPVGNGGCPTGGCPSGTCPSGGGNYGGAACGQAGCSPLSPKCVRDARSYSYSQPTNLVYPSQGATGGGVVYPYYTHKSPSDFFRQ